MRFRRGRRIGILAIALVVGLLPTVPVSGAVFSAVTDGSAAFATDTLDAPTSLATTTVIGLTANFTWIATADLYAEGHRLYRRPTSGSTYTLVGTITPRTTSTASNTPIVPGSYTFVVRAFAGSWQSPASNAITVFLL